MIEEINGLFNRYGYSLTFKDICQMMYEQGYIDKFGFGFEAYYSGLFEED